MADIAPPRRVLFMTNSELGQATVHLATAHDLLLRPDYDVHFASFLPLKSAVESVNEKAAVTSNGAASKATFHAIAGKSMLENAARDTEFIEMHKPGFFGAMYAYANVFPKAFGAWDGPDYVNIYKSCVDIVHQVQPDLVAVDPAFTQGSDACRATKTKYVVLSPNTFKDHVLGDQPNLNFFWKYPMTATGWRFPLPWYLILANIICTIRLLLNPLVSTTMRKYLSYRKQCNVPGECQLFYEGFPEDLPVLLPAGANVSDYPFYVPKNYVSCGPIVQPAEPLAQSDPELNAWMAHNPTVVINLGSHVLFDEALAIEYVTALRVLLETHPATQILWKMKSKKGAAIRTHLANHNGPFALIAQEMKDDRIRITDWLNAEPIAILQSGKVAAMVHHGGANSYFEAVAAGVPQVVLPVWIDTFDFADRVEWLGVGLWGSRKSAPKATADELAAALTGVVGGPESEGMRQRAKALAAKVGGTNGRALAAAKIHELVTEWRKEKSETTEKAEKTEQATKKVMHKGRPKSISITVKSKGVEKALQSPLSPVQAKLTESLLEWKQAVSV